MLTFAVTPQRVSCAACHTASIAPYGLCVVRAAQGDEPEVLRGEADRVSRPLCMHHFSAAVDVAIPEFLPPATAEL